MRTLDVWWFPLSEEAAICVPPGSGRRSRRTLPRHVPLGCRPCAGDGVCIAERIARSARKSLTAPPTCEKVDLLARRRRHGRRVCIPRAHQDRGPIKSYKPPRVSDPIDLPDSRFSVPVGRYTVELSDPGVGAKVPDSGRCLHGVRSAPEAGAERWKPPVSLFCHGRNGTPI